MIGIFAALYMARRGLKVLVCEKGRIAVEQSSRNWGWIRQQGRDHAELLIMMTALGLWHEVNRETNGGYTLALSRTHPFYVSPDAWGTPRRWSEGVVTSFERMRVLEPVASKREIARMRRAFAEKCPGIGAPVIRDAWAGMSGHGFGIGPGFGDVIARLAANEPQAHDIGRFRFGRFTDGSRLELGPVL